MAKKKPAKSINIPVTQKMLFKVRDQLVSRMDRRFHELKAEIQGGKAQTHGLKSEIHGIKSEVHGLKSEVHGLKSEVHGLKSEVHGLKEEMHRLAILVEEQNARNIFVLDGLTALFHRQDRVEKVVATRA